MAESTVNRLPPEIVRNVAKSCLCLHAQRAARALSRRFDEAFRPLGLTNGQFSLLMALNRPEPPTIGQIASFLAIDRTSLTAALKPLQRRGLVTVTTGRDDRRNRIISITAEGVDLLGRALPLWGDVQAELDDLIGQDIMHRLRAGLNDVCERVK